MKKFSKISILTIVISLMIGLTGSTVALAATSPSLGAASTYGIYAGGDQAYINTSATTTVLGDVGFTIVPAIAPLPSPRPSTTYPNYGTVGNYLTASTSIANALTALNSQPCGNGTTIPGFTFSPGVIVLTTNTQRSGGASPIYTPGVYCSTGAMSVGAGITLTGAGTYIFRTSAGTLDAEGSSVVTLSGASACDVFWTPDGAVTIGANAEFVGTVIPVSQPITLLANVSWIGRALSLLSPVTTGDTDTITVPTGCAAAATSHRRTVTPTPTPIIVPVIGLTKIPTPLSLPQGPGKVTYNYSAWNVAKLQPLIDITLVDDKCSPIVFVSGDNNANGLLDIDEVWKYSCSSNLVSTTTNTAIATAHSSDGHYTTAIATAIATVIVGSSIQPPLINVVKVPSQLTPFPYGGGDVTYTYTVTNPGVIALNNVTVTDDKCPSVSYVSGDNNHNNLLDTNESWIYICKQNIKVSTGNVATAKGMANGLTALSYSFVNVLVNVPSLPNTGLGLEGITISWFDIILVIAVIVLSIWLAKVMKKIKKQAKI